jgi:hypothetical protein
MNIHDVVALLEDMPEKNLRRGEVGTIVEIWQVGVSEVELSGTDGVAYAMAALREDQLMKLYMEPAQASA